MGKTAAKVFLAEDTTALIKFEKEFIEDPAYGHQIVVLATSRKEALDNISAAKAGGVNVAVLDGSLGTGPDDGPTIAKALKKAIPGIVIISFSYDKVKWGDLNLLKPDDGERLAETIMEALSGKNT